MNDDFAHEVARLANEAVETNDSLSDGLANLLVGKRITAVTGEVWSSDGECAFEITLEDGTKLECPGQAWIHGPAAELFRMAGGIPTYEETEEGRK